MNPMNPLLRSSIMTLLEELVESLVLGELLAEITSRFGGYDLIAHWTQGEFHHDLVVCPRNAPADARVLVIATNCNGGVKEVLAFDHIPTRSALWAHRCENAALDVRGFARTLHWFDPCELLADDARSELRPEFRRRQEGGGWVMNDNARGSDQRGSPQQRKPI
jgi:hypothetical protein